MASPTFPASSLMCLDLPESQYLSSFDPTNNHPLGVDQTPHRTRDSEDDIQSLFGISISRTQTRLRSSLNPTLEKATTLHHDNVTGFFHRTPSGRQYDGSPDETSLPSPWTAEPKPFRRQSTHPQQEVRMDKQNAANTGTMGILADLNIQRFLTSFAMPSLPKLSGMTFPKLMGSKTMAPQIIDTKVERERANMPGGPISHWLPPRPASPDPQTSLAEPKKTSASGELMPNGGLIDQDRPTSSGTRVPNHATRYHLSPQPSLKRSFSDQSLAIRRPSSMGSSLGDDARWANVQKQVNSRAKAIADSLQDSYIRLPSLSSVNLSSLRPDFLRNRAASDTVRLPPFKQWSSTSSAVNHGNPSQQAKYEHGKAAAIQPPKNAAIFDESNRLKPSPKSGNTNFEQALESLTGDVVVMGGYRGSILRSAKPPYRQLWIPVKVGLNIRKVNLEVGLDAEDEESMEDTIFSSGMLSHIGPVDMGRRLLKRLKSCRNAQQGKLSVHDYGYDWRLSPHLLSHRLIRFLETLHQDTDGRLDGEKGATVIAHSLGGLITRHAVNQRPELFAGVIYAGVPQHCINILGPLRHGDEVLLSSKVLTAQVNFTLRTSYLLLPDDGRCFIDKGTKEEYPVNFFDLADWRRYAFSPCIAPASPPFALPERKSLFTSVTDTLMALPLVGRKDSLTKTKTEIIRNAVKADVDPRLDAPVSDDSPVVPQSTIPLAKAEEYLARTLAATVCFRNELKFDPHHAHENRYPPLAILYGTSVPTVVRARVASKDAIKCMDAYDDLAFASGDGVCLARAAMLPAGYECMAGGKIRTERGHVGLLGDLEAVGKCLISVMEGRKKGIGLGPNGRVDAHEQ
ncbi:MAG: hypothetical protein Q9186_007387 [Xanthomendoza sp. 1 TL-2023]